MGWQDAWVRPSRKRPERALAWTVGEVAAELGVPRATVSYWCSTGRIESWQPSGRGGKRLIPKEALRRYLSGDEVGGRMVRRTGDGGRSGGITPRSPSTTSANPARLLAARLRHDPTDGSE